MYAGWNTLYGAPTLSGPQTWHTTTDGNGQSIDYVNTTNQWGSATNWAVLSYSASADCAIEVYIPNADADANPARFEVKTADGVWHQTPTNEATTSGWMFLLHYGATSSPPIEIAVPNEDGTTSHQLGIGVYFYWIC